MKIKERHVAILLILGLGCFACGKKKDNNDNPGEGNGKNVLGVSSSIDKDLAGTWELDTGSFKFEKTIKSDGQSEEKIWEDSSLNFHIKTKIKQESQDSPKKFIEEILSVEVATGSFAGAQSGHSQKCIYKIKTESNMIFLHYSCDEDYPNGLTDESNVLMKK